ncbi:MAG TPA: alkaline phosphatase family protein [Gammaproteobacteria bacterium]
MRDGRRVLSLGTSGLGPEEELRAQMEAYGIPLDRLQSYTRFQGSIAGERVMNETMLVAAEGWQGVSLGETAAREFSFTVGDSEFYGLVLAGGGPNRVAVCVETRDLGDASSCDELEAGGEGDDLDRWSRPFAVTSGNLVGRAYFRLFELTPDGSRMIFYQRSVSGIRNPTDDQEAFLDDVGGLGAGLGYGIYRAGELGATLAEGGEGAAETRLVELARFNAGLWVRAIRAGLDRYAPDVLTTYEDATDSAGHAWVGVLDPRSPMFDATLADAIWPSYVEIFKLQDEVLLDVLDRVDGNTIVTVVSDHGMSGIGKAFSANAVLEDAGLVFRDEDGMVDLSRTAIYGAWGSDYFLNVNSTDWKDGIVEPDEIEDVLDQATEALLSVIDPDTGQHVVTRVFRSDEIVALGMGGEAGGDLYMDFAYGYVPVDDPSPVLRPSAFAMGAGTHGFYPHRKEMQTIWFARGAGILPGQVLSPLRQIDIAPTLATLAGFGIPADARGHVIGELVR